MAGWQSCTCPGAREAVTFHWPGSCATCSHSHARIATTSGHWTWLCTPCLPVSVVWYYPVHTPADDKVIVDGHWIIDPFMLKRITDETGHPIVPVEQLLLPM